MDFSSALGKPCGSNEEFVTGLYQSVLERQPDSAGAALWLGKLQSGAARDNIYRQFFASVEYVQKNKSDRQFIRDAYQAVLGREPDEGGTNLWMAKLQEKKTKRVNVLNALLASPEYKTIMSRCK